MRSMVDAIGLPAVLEQGAEECAELAHAVLKLSRIVRNENPTPSREGDVIKAIIEEYADLEVVMGELRRCGLIRMEDVYMVMTKKTKRWEERLNVGQGQRERDRMD